MSSKTYEVTGETTEWEDILIKKGIRTYDEVLTSKGLNPLDFIPPEPPKEDDGELNMEKANSDDLDDLEDGMESDLVLEQYRIQRLEELKRQKLRNRFGEVYDLARDEWIREVTDGSKLCWVVVLLYSDAVIECRVMQEYLIILAKKFKDVKFLKIPSIQAVENWPDRNLPTLFVYHDGVLQHQLITFKQLIGISCEALELWLAAKNIITSELDPDEVEENLQQKASINRSISGPGRTHNSNYNRSGDEDDET